MQINHSITSVTMPPGEYWIGDPAYAITDPDTWTRWVDAADADPSIYVVIGWDIVGCETGAIGEGVFADTDGNEYPVDSGMIGLVAKDLWTGVDLNNGTQTSSPEGMWLVQFNREFTVTNVDGRITIGHITIDTTKEADR